ncbi:ExbD/TolR family protein [Litoribacillus peritrichatus]|uniref:Biopolymer transporter ExbD n=1 Tax=Litoribacillus peritrichatus TaxID=718191 RepID=A0ABP7M8F2_9GAMM
MALGQRRRKSGDLDVEIDMVPVMNMFLVLIPFLLMSANFLPFNVINTSVPVKSETPVDDTPDKKVSDIKVTAVVKLEKDGIYLSATSGELAEDKLKEMDKFLPIAAGNQYAYSDLSASLDLIKTLYPKSDTLILTPSGDILYDSIVDTMDASRSFNEKPLFKHVVISGEVDS